MHPQVRQPEPGQCPICGMDLIPVQEESGGDIGPRQLKLSKAARKLAEIQTATVQRQLPEREIRMVGKVDYDETRVRHITARVPGRLDRLFVDYTGVPVQKGDHLVSLYSPELLAAQEELIRAKATVEKMADSEQEMLKQRAEATVESAREKLRLWGLTDAQVADIEERGEATEHLTIYSPISGIVIEKPAVEGKYVDTGSRIYTVADLSRVWVQLDAYESDLPWLRYGQQVYFESEAYPGERFEGQIAFIDPILDPATRTVNVRVNVSNESGQLKPGMFVRGTVKAKLAAEGKVVNPGLAGKWISPMHPEIVKDAPGTCDVCGMPLVKAETLGYVAEAQADPPLVIPASAPLITGERVVVYVSEPTDDGIFTGREIRLGPRANDLYIVRSGLQAGEKVVVNGAFKIDSAVQIQAKPSMMNPEGGAPPPGHAHGADHAAMEEAAKVGETAEKIAVPSSFNAEVQQLYGAYLPIQHALAGDDLNTAQEAGDAFVRGLAAMDGTGMNQEASARWKQSADALKKAARKFLAAGDIEAARRLFAGLSEEMIHVIETFAPGIDRSAFVLFCPMAFENRGAVWLQAGKDVENPYFGVAMLKCGEVRKVLSDDSEEEQHE
jgi:Cu(I)/Ag(I) efflux system membrane fusion protein